MKRRSHSRWYFQEDLSNKNDLSGGIVGRIYTPNFLRMQELCRVNLRNFSEGGVGLHVADREFLPNEFYLELPIGNPPLQFKCRMTRRSSIGHGMSYVGAMFLNVQDNAFQILTDHWLEHYADGGLDNFEANDL